MAGGKDKIWRTIIMPTTRKYSAIKIVFNTYFIDYWSGDRIIIYLNNQIVNDFNPYSILTSTPPIIYCSMIGGDFADSHLQSQTHQLDFTEPKLSIEISRFGLPITRVFGLSNFYLYIQYCGEHCDSCDSKGQCETCSDGFILLDNDCLCPEFSAQRGYFKFYNPSLSCVTSCPAGFVADLANTCQPGISDLLFQDLYAPGFTSYLFYLMKDKYYSEASDDFRIFQVNSVSVAGPFLYNEKLLLSPLSIIANANILVKFRLYFVEYTGSRQVGAYIKVRFNNYPVLEIRDFEYAYGSSPVGSFVSNGFTPCTYDGIYQCNYMDIQFRMYLDYEVTAIMLDGQFTIIPPYRGWGFRDFYIYKETIIGSVQQCHSPCQTCDYRTPSVCTSCITGYYLFTTLCLISCPLQTTLTGSSCVENGISDPIVYAFNALYDDNNYADQIFNISVIKINMTLSKYWHGLQYYTMLGGFVEWSYQIQQYQINTTYQFYKAYVKMNVVCFDCLVDENLLISFDNVVSPYRVTRTASPSEYLLSSVGNLVGQLTNEYEAEVFIPLSSFVSKNTLLITMQKENNNNPSEYFGVYNFRVMVVPCPLFCNACDAAGICTTWLVAIEVSSGACANQYYYDPSSQSCIACSVSCQVCTSSQHCVNCNPGFVLVNWACYCSGFNEIMMSCSNSLTLCQPGCKRCGEDTMVNQLQYQGYNQNCIECDESKHLWLDMVLCKCVQGYYMEQDVCQPCSKYCKSCQKQPRICTECNTTTNRELHFQQCECKQGYYEEDSNVNCNVCDPTCYTCRFFTDYCTSCYPDQFRTVLNRVCVCANGYFDEGISICTKCGSKCQTCISLTYCKSCYASQNRKLSLVSNTCICKVGYFEVENQLYCDSCHYTCQQCQPSPLQNMCTRCPSSREPSINDTVFSCVCKRGYYESNMKECSDCRNYINPPTTHYCYSHCGDKVIQWNEDCDDGNQDYKDGCYQCLFTTSYCLNALCTKCEMSVCVACIDGYFLNKDSQCEKCDQSCLTCVTRYDNCLACQLHNKDGTCQMCQIDKGYQIADNKCTNICGDGLKINGEQCDDGNDKSGDGCSKCQVEDGWICQNVCERIIYPEIIFTTNKYDDSYNGIRNVIVSTNIPLKIKGVITDLCSFAVEDEESFDIQINKDVTKYTADYNILEIQLQLQLQSRSTSPKLICKIKRSASYISQQGFTFKDPSFSTILLAYNKQSQAVVSATEGLLNLSKYVLYVLLGLAIFAFLVGGLHIFWNLLDVLQLISYLQFLNVIYPYNVETYFQLFSFAQFDFIKSIVDVESILNNYVVSPQPDFKFANEGYSTTFFVNGVALFLVFITTLLTYLGCRFGFVLLSKMLQYYTDDQDTSLEEEPNVIKFILFRISRNIEKMLLKVVGEFRSGVIRTFMAIAYDYNLAIFLQIRAANMSNSILCASFVVSFLFLVVQGYFVYKGFTFMSRQPYYYEQFFVEQSYGSLYEGIIIKASNPFSNYYNIILLLRKILFMLFLVNLYFESCFQILMCSFLNIIFTAYIIYNKPLEDKYEYIKTIGSEILIWIAELLILLLYYYQQYEFDEQQQLLIGWFVIAACTILILFQLFLDVKQHFEYLIKEFKIIGRLLDRIRGVFNKQQPVEETQENLVDMTKSKHTLKEKSSTTLLRQRKLVTFTIDH